MLREVNIHVGKVPPFSMWIDPATRHGQYFLTYFSEGYSYEPEVVHVVLKAVRSGDVVIDVGACLGFYALLMANMGAHVIAVEPEEDNLSVLKSNVPESVKVIPEPLWRVPEGISFYKCVDDSSSSALWDVGTWKDNPVSKAHPQVQMRNTLTLDMIAKPPVRLIKIDTEGTEQAILEGGMELLHSHPPFIITEFNPNGLNQLGYSIESLREFMRSQGYDLFFLHHTGEFPSLIPPQLKIKSNVEQAVKNVMFSTMQDVAEIYADLEMNPYVF